MPCEIYFADRWIKVEGEIKTVLDELAGTRDRSFVKLTSADGNELWLRPSAVLGVAKAQDRSAFAGDEGSDLGFDED